jgi:hypothetical protein
MGNLLQQGDQFIESELPADNSRGRNGDNNPSSAYKAPAPIKNVASPQATVADSVWQTRAVDASPIAAHLGMRSPTNLNGVPSLSNMTFTRPVTRKI